MLLSSDLFDQVSSGLSAAPAASSGAVESAGRQDQRQSVRLRGEGAEATVIPLTPSASGAISMPFRVQLRDISPGGVGFVHAGAVRLDQEFVILLPTSGSGPLAVMGQVAYWQPLGGALVGVGMKFSRVLRQGGGQAAAPIETPTRQYRAAS